MVKPITLSFADNLPMVLKQWQLLIDCWQCEKFLNSTPKYQRSFRPGCTHFQSVSAATPYRTSFSGAGGRLYYPQTKPTSKPLFCKEGAYRELISTKLQVSKFERLIHDNIIPYL